MRSPVARLREYADKNNLTLVLKALDFGEACHKNDKRDDGTDFINHPAEAALILIELGVKDEVILAAVILHDTVEKKRATYNEIIIVCGLEVAFFVHLVTQKPGEKLEDHYEIMSKYIRAILVKAPDNLHNLCNMIGVFTPDKIERNMEKSENFVVPMIKKAQINHPEYREILIKLGGRITEKLNELRNYLELVCARHRLLDVLLKAEFTMTENILPAESERRRI